MRLNALVLGCCVAFNATAKDPVTSQEVAKQSYSLGYQMALQSKKSLELIKSQGFDANKDEMIKGFLDTFNGTLKFNKEKLDHLVGSIQKSVSAKKAALAKINLEKGEAYLALKAKDKNVITTDSGLLYEIVQQAEGKNPIISDAVEVHYRGELLDGTIFDSSYKRKQTSTFNIGGVIKGWQIGIPLMTVGSTYRFYIPADLAYGDTSIGKIPEQSALIFEVELVAIRDDISVN
jgi:FKBP-type peptidyl-prolyl cis-trans isomerase FkpA